jgi:hypothetical protein
MSPMLIVNRRMNTINNLVKGTMLAKGPPASHNSMKITIQEMLLKAFSTLTCIMT